MVAHLSPVFCEAENQTVALEGQWGFNLRHQPSLMTAGLYLSEIKNGERIESLGRGSLFFLQFHQLSSTALEVEESHPLHTGTVGPFRTVSPGGV